MAISLLAKGVKEGAKLFKKYDGKFEQLMDELQGITPDTPGATATGRGAVVGKDRTKSFGNTKAIKGSVYTGLSGLGLMTLSSMFGEEEDPSDLTVFSNKGLDQPKKRSNTYGYDQPKKRSNTYGVNQLPKEGASIIEGNDFTMYSNSNLKKEALNSKGKTFKFSGDGKTYNVNKIMKTFKSLEEGRDRKAIGSKITGKILDLTGKLADVATDSSKDSFLKKEFLRDLSDDPDFESAINDLPEEDYKNLMDDIGFDYDMGSSPISSNIDSAMNLDAEEAALSYMDFGSFEKIQEYLNTRNPNELRLFIRTLQGNRGTETDDRVIEAAQKMLMNMTQLKVQKADGGAIEQSNRGQDVRNFLSKEEPTDIFRGSLNDNETEALGIFPTNKAVREFRADQNVMEQRRQQKVVNEARTQAELERQGYNEGGGILQKLQKEMKMPEKGSDEFKALQAIRDIILSPTKEEKELPTGKKGNLLFKPEKGLPVGKKENLPFKPKKGSDEFEALQAIRDIILSPTKEKSSNATFAEGGMPVDTYDNIPPEEMEAAMASQLPDEDMEDQYINFVMDKSLSEEDQDYLAVRLEQDPKLSEILDSIVLTAGEFSGSGEVEGPGSGVSDSIPARLSDGEFVFTRKATDQLGSDNLQRMMDDAERAYDGGYQKKAVGGYMFNQEQSQVASPSSIDEEIKRAMIGSNKIPSLL